MIRVMVPLRRLHAGWGDNRARPKDGDACACGMGTVCVLVDGTQACTRDLAWYVRTYKRPFPIAVATP